MKMTFEQCNDFIESIKHKTFGLVNSDGRAVKILLPLPVNIKPEHLQAWIVPFWSYGIHPPVQPFQELLKRYEEFAPAYLFLLAEDDPTSAQIKWLDKDFPALLSK